MARTRCFTTLAVALTIAMAAGPALAQNRDRERTRPPDRSVRGPGADTQERGRDDGSARGTRTERQDIAVRRTTPPPPDGARGAREEQRNNSRGYDERRYDNDRRGSDRYDRGRDDRGRDDSRYDRGRGYDYGRYDRYDRYDRSGWERYDRDVWRSRIRFGLGVSVFSGTPFRFHFSYGWRPSFPYHYPMRVGVAYGGMSFLLDPDWAEVYIDGVYVGIVRDFRGQPVPVAAGYRRIELYAPGFEPVGFNVHVLPGQVIPYRGTLYRSYW